MNCTRLVAKSLVFFSLLPSLSFAISLACADLLDPLSKKRLTASGLPLVVTDPPDRNFVTTRNDSYKDVGIEITRDNLNSVAETLALGGEVEPIRTQLAEQLGDGDQVVVSLKEFLPERIRKRLGTCDGNANCYGTAMNFHYSTSWKPDRVNTMAFPRLAGGDSLKFGDLIVIKRRDTIAKQDFQTHAVVYLGGDFVLHKYGADSRAKYEITVFQNVHSMYQKISRQSPGPSSGLNGPSAPFKEYEFRRYDPQAEQRAKEMAEADKKASLAKEKELKKKKKALRKKKKGK